jgi:D-beta-D-heptose 7-phosphate kinase/D-beta-D-heptose 1-phosphate adenosyltransferase
MRGSGIENRGPGKIFSSTALAKKLASLRSRGKRIVFTNGCFDILHVGHVEYLGKARKLGDLLVIGLNSDKSVRKIKGDSRPINRQADRAKVLSALSFVDYVTIFNEDTPESLIKKLKPDVLAKGGDWKPKDIVGGDFVKSRGGRVVSIPFVEGYSTTSLLRKLAL